MRRISSIAIVVTVLAAWIAGDALGRPGRGGGGGPRPGGAGGGARPSGGNVGGGHGARPSGGSPKASAPGGNLGGQFSGGLNKSAAGGPGNVGGQFGANQFNGQRPNSQQLQQFLGGDGAKAKAGEFKSGEFARGEHAGQGKEQFQAQAREIQSNVQARADELFTPQWYAEHPNAWQATHPHADAFAVATAASVAAWVGTAAYAGGGDTVVVESGTTEETPEATEDAAATGTTPTIVPAATDPSEWMTIGVFALAQTGQTEPTTLIQLAVNKQGQLNGSYYDLVSDNGTPVSGQVDTTTQRAAWTVGPNSKNVFATTIETLTSDNGSVTLHLPNGKTQNWNLVRVNKAAK